jgi:hypothetical protein
MEPTEQIQNYPPFDEEAWIRLIFLLSDTQDWLTEMVMGAVMQVPMKQRKNLFRRGYYITIAALAHILERHYYKVHRHPDTSKFTISLPEILSHLRDISKEPGIPIAGSIDFRRTVDVHKIIGYDRNHIPTTFISVITDNGGRITTAFPGNHFILAHETNQS